MWHFLARVYNIRAGKRSAQIFSYDRRRCVRWIEKIEKFMLYRLQWICDNFASKAYKFTYMYVTCILWKHKTLRILLATEIYLSLWNLQFQKLSKLTVICQGKHSCIVYLKKTFVCTRYVHVILDLSPFGIFNKK